MEKVLVPENMPKLSMLSVFNMLLVFLLQFSLGSKSSPILNYECWARSWSRFLGSHEAGGRLLLLYTRPAVTIRAKEITPLGRYQIILLDVSCLPKTTRQLTNCVNLAIVNVLCCVGFSRQKEFRFPAPPKPGVYQYTVILRSDSYLGLDQSHTFKVLYDAALLELAVWLVLLVILAWVSE